MGKPHQQRNERLRQSPSSQRVRPDKRYANNYRFPPEVIARWTRICIWTFLGSCVLAAGCGFIVVAMDDAGEASLLEGIIAIAALIGGAGIAFSFGAAAFLGGEAIARFGGWIGVLLTVGLVTLLVGAATLPLVRNIGFWVSGLAVAGFFVIGIRARVPIWFKTDR